jgi:hypothetical protein
MGVLAHGNLHGFGNQNRRESLRMGLATTTRGECCLTVIGMVWETDTRGECWRMYSWHGFHRTGIGMIRGIFFFYLCITRSVGWLGLSGRNVESWWQISL